MTDRPLFAGIELGGTKCICILARGPDDIVDEQRIPTTTPAETLAAIEAALARWSGFAAMGIASFGPVSLDRSSPDYGYITATPKAGWRDTNIAERLRRRFDVPTAFHTDVTGAALGEGRWGAAQGLDDFAYVTVGTGIGVGMIAHGAPVDGMSHAELGHIRPVRLAGDDWPGRCSFHGACVEGLASGPAIADQAGRPGPELTPDDPVWGKVAHALAQLLATLVLTGVPRRIVMGGGVMTGNDHLFPKLRTALADSLAGYVQTREIADLDRYVVPAALGGNAGPLGAIVMAMTALDRA
ncbi:ROK family protein [Sphingomonas koreensis]|nr:ROK family protein [Sphingomonas koreensis]TPG39047.1 ROK family protein [Sphingomonas koreensis]